MDLVAITHSNKVYHMTVVGEFSFEEYKNELNTNSHEKIVFGDNIISKHSIESITSRENYEANIVTPA